MAELRTFPREAEREQSAGRVQRGLRRPVRTPWTDRPADHLGARGARRDVRRAGRRRARDPRRDEPPRHPRPGSAAAGSDGARTRRPGGRRRPARAGATVADGHGDPVALRVVGRSDQGRRRDLDSRSHRGPGCRPGAGCHRHTDPGRSTGLVGHRAGADRRRSPATHRPRSPSPRRPTPRRRPLDRTRADRACWTRA